MSTKVRAWQKVFEVVKVRENARYKPSPHLEVRQGARKTSFRVNFRAEGIELRKTLKGRFATIDDWEDASRAAEKLIANARFGEKELPKDMVRSEAVIAQLLEEAKDQDAQTIQGKEYIYKKYMIPWLNEHFPYAADLNVTAWPRYKAHLRSSDPTRALENHAKYFRTFQNRVFELGIIKQKISLNFDVKKEDFRKSGLVIPDDILTKMLAAAESRKNRAWFGRILLGRYTGLRPSEARQLRKRAVPHPKDPAGVLLPNIEFVLDGLLIRIYPEDNKENRYREFKVTSAAIVQEIKAQCEIARFADSPYVFPMIEDITRPMAANLGNSKDPEKAPGSWHWIVWKAGGKDFTPHDLRHTYATEMFKKSRDWAQLCFQLDMSLETAQEVYIHLKAEDTAGLADVAAQSLLAKKGGVQ